MEIAQSGINPPQFCMSNKASNQLHELIHSLSSVEKRYFKLFSERHHTKAKKEYLKLFTVIDKQKVYDEKKVIAAFSEAAFIKHLSIAKNRLYHQILKSLDAFYAQSSAEAEINRYLHYSEILLQKTLYNQCDRILNTAQKLALKYEKWGALIQIIRRQKRLAEIGHYEKKKGQEIDDLRNLELETLEKIETESSLWHAKSKLFYRLFTKGQMRDQKGALKMKPEVDKVKSICKSGNETFEAQYLANHTESAFYFSLGDYPKSYLGLSANAKLIEDNIEIIKDEPTIYTSILTNLIYVCAKLNKFDEVDEYLFKSRNLPSKLTKSMTEDQQLKIFVNSNSLELAICNILGNNKRGIALIGEIEEGLNKWGDKLSEVRRASFYQEFSTLYFAAGDFKKALKWNNELLNSIAIDKTEDQYCFSQMFHLLIHFELNNIDIIPHGMKSLNRYLQMRKRHFKFEKAFIDFMKNAQKTYSDEQKKKTIALFLRAIVPLEHDQFERAVFEYFDFITWAESKIENIEMSKLLLKKAPQKDIL
jgi:hypothetical protein